MRSSSSSTATNLLSQHFIRVFVSHHNMNHCAASQSSEATDRNPDPIRFVASLPDANHDLGAMRGRHRVPLSASFSMHYAPQTAPPYQTQVIRLGKIDVLGRFLALIWICCGGGGGTGIWVRGPYCRVRRGGRSGRRRQCPPSQLHVSDTRAPVH